MGYTLELRSTPPGAVVAELTRPTLDPRQIDFRPYGQTAVDLEPRWSTAAATVAEAVATGGGAVGGTLALYVHFVMRAVGTFQGSLDHSSGGGDDFRRRFLPGPAARLLGLDVVVRLLNRDLAGLTWTDMPSFGWVTAADLVPVVDGFPADLASLTDDEDDVLALQTLVRACRRTVRLGADLVTAYG